MAGTDPVGSCTASNPQGTSDTTNYYSRVGESLSQVAGRFGMSEEHLRATNPDITNPDFLTGETVKIVRDTGAVLQKPAGVCDAPLEAASKEWSDRGFFGRLGAADQDGWGQSFAIGDARQFKRQCDVEPQAARAVVVDGITARLSAYDAGKLQLSPEEAVKLRSDERIVQDVYHPGAPERHPPESVAETRYLQEKQLWAENTMGMSVLGLFGLPALATRAFGGDEKKVSAAVQGGAQLFDLVTAHMAIKQSGQPMVEPPMMRSQLEPAGPSVMQLGALPAVKPPQTATQRAAGFPEGLSFRTDLPRHLAGPHGFKGQQLYGTHNLDNAVAALAARGIAYRLEPTGTRGILELKYETINPNGKSAAQSKTVYDPKVYSDAQMLAIVQSGGQRAFELFLKNPGGPTSFQLTQDGVHLKVYINHTVEGIAYIGNVHPIK
jgi:hypothetical protein